MKDLIENILVILVYVLIMGLGAFLSNKNIVSNKILKKIDKIQVLSLLLLLFIMGVSIGIDREIMESFLQIGITGVLFAISSIIFSILFLNIVYRIFFKRKGGVDLDD